MVITNNYKIFSLLITYWSEKWLFEFNTEKCHKIFIGHNLPTAYFLTGVNGAKQKKKEISEF